MKAPMNNGIAGDDIIVDRLWQQQKLRTFESRLAKEGPRTNGREDMRGQTLIDG
jgi:hypothetical protein